MSEVRTAPRRLVDLKPKWIENEAGEIYGIGYDCPCGLPMFDPQYDENGKVRIGEDGKVVGAVPYADCCKVGGRQSVPVKTTWLADRVVSANSKQHGWELSGTSFENIVLRPSIHQVGHWHGWLGGAGGEQPGMLVSC